jgi:hypothetical protein
MYGLGNGVTPHYIFQYDDSLQQTCEPGRTNAVIAACEDDYNWLSNFFNIPGPGPLNIYIGIGSYGANRTDATVSINYEGLLSELYQVTASGSYYRTQISVQYHSVYLMA